MSKKLFSRGMALLLSALMMIGSPAEIYADGRTVIESEAEENFTEEIKDTCDVSGNTPIDDNDVSQNESLDEQDVSENDLITGDDCEEENLYLEDAPVNLSQLEEDEWAHFYRHTLSYDGYTLGTSAVILYPGESYALHPGNVGTLTYSVDDSLVASVSEDGVITALSIGETYVRAHSELYGDENCKVSVVADDDSYISSLADENIYKLTQKKTVTEYDKFILKVDAGIYVEPGFDTIISNIMDAIEDVTGYSFYPAGTNYQKVVVEVPNASIEPCGGFGGIALDDVCVAPSYTAQLYVSVHELIHCAQARQYGDAVGLLFTEGYAEIHVDEVISRLPLLWSPCSQTRNIMIDDLEYKSHSKDEAEDFFIHGNDSHLYSYWICKYIVSEYGKEKLDNIIEKVIDKKIGYYDADAQYKLIKDELSVSFISDLYDYYISFDRTIGPSDATKFKEINPYVGNFSRWEDNSFAISCNTEIEFFNEISVDMKGIFSCLQTILGVKFSGIDMYVYGDVTVVTYDSEKKELNSYTIQGSGRIREKNAVSYRMIGSGITTVEIDYNTYSEIIDNCIEHLEKVEGAEPTCLSEGIEPHWRCSKCGKLYLYTNPSFEIKQGNIVIPKRTDHLYVYTHNGDGTHTVSCKYGDLEETTEKCDYVRTIYEDNSYTDTCKKCGYEDKHLWGDVLPEDAIAAGYTLDTVPKSLWYVGVPVKVTYNTLAQTFDIHLYDGRKRLYQGIDYTAKYTANTNPGTAQIVLTGKGNYSFSVTKTFEIEKYDISGIAVEPVLTQENGKVQKLEVTVSVMMGDKKVVLKNGTDYTLSYPGTNSKTSDYDRNAFRAAGEYTINITGKGRYTGTTTAVEKIIARSDYTYIGKTNITVSNIKYDREKAKSETGIVPNVTIKRGKNKLSVYYSKASTKEDALAEYNAQILLSGEDERDFVCFFENNRAATSSAKVTIVGIEDRGYLGSVTKTFKITGSSLKDAKYSSLAKKTYTGNAVYQEFTVKSKNGKNILAGISAEEYELLSDSEKYGYDYIYQYKSNINKGSASIVITGINGYTETVTKKFNISAYNIANDQKLAEESRRICCSFEDTLTEETTITHVKGGAKPEVKVLFFLNEEWTELVKGADYTVSYVNNRNVATATSKKAPTVKITGKGNFTGTLSMKFDIEEADISELTASAADRAVSTSVGAYRSAIKITDKDGKTLVSDKDYVKRLKYYQVYEDGSKGWEIEVNEFVPAGSLVWVEATGKGNYQGTVHAIYRIARYDISKAEITVASKEYTGKPIVPTKDDVTKIRIKDGKKYLTIDPSQYEIVEVYSNTDAGKGKVVIKGIGEFCGTKTVSFSITPRIIN
ncbi:MAG: hypothetical protein K6A74_07665 [Lachnospiraceae bacterium]|nr:hypothetical protein [Lachnospiraceae bacterium]